MYITAQGPRLRNDIYFVEWDVKLYYTLPYRLTYGAQPENEVTQGHLNRRRLISYLCRRLRFSSDADIVRLTHARIIIIIIMIPISDP